MARQFYFDAWHELLLRGLTGSTDVRIAEIAAKALKEVRYHVERSARLGDPAGRRHRREPSQDAGGDRRSVDVHRRDVRCRRDRARADRCRRRLRRARAGRAVAAARRRGARRGHADACPRTAGCRAAADAAGGRASTPSTSGRCSRRCNCCSAPIRERNGDVRCATCDAKAGTAIDVGLGRARRAISGPGDSGDLGGRARHRARASRGATIELVVTLTPTYSGCPATEVIAADVAAALAEAGVADARIETRLAPAWTTDWIAPAARGAADRVRHRPAGRFAPRCRRSTSARLRRRSDCAGDSVSALRLDAHARAVAFRRDACKAQYRCDDCLEPFDYFKPH